MSGIQAPSRRAVFAVAVFVAAFLLLASGPVRAADAPDNDDFENAKIIRGDSASIRGDNEFATREKGEADHVLSGSSVRQNTVWYRWTAWRSGSVEASVCESRLDTVLAVYTKDAKSGMEKVADNDDGCSARNQRGSSLIFEAKLEETYWISVSGYSTTSAGPFTLELAPPPDAG